MKAKYITTTLPYVNSDPHIGFAYELVQADAITRYWRLLGQEVFFNTGTDEHGQKIADKADEKGESRQAYVDYYANEFKKLADAKTGLNLSYAEGGNFIRTTDEAHKMAAQEMWRRCATKGDIYKKKYKGLYCVGCELFYKEDELDENKCCLIHGKPTTEVEEENYFFKLSNYQTYLEEYLSKEGVIVPEWRRQEAINFVKGGLQDFSISREKARLNWGVPVPGDDDQVMYVWFDALTNYISTLGWPEEDGDFKKFWTGGEVVQLGGKDQVRFQSVMWQAMLRSAGVKATDKVVYHGFINSGGQKMSKSLGNVISPYEMIARYGADATRYLLLRHVHPFDDSDVTLEKLDEWYTAGLVNGLGNLVSRITNMAEKYVPESKRLQFSEEEIFPEFNNSINAFRFDSAIDFIWHEIGILDQEIQDREPFKLVKVDEQKAIEVVNELMKDLYWINSYLFCLMPDTADIIKKAIINYKKPENLFPRLEK
ncbi:MAG: methionine--tRNA ligase [Candidatus Paceibacterota bacterium]